MNCPICNKELTLVEGRDILGNSRFNYVCESEGSPHFMTDSYARKEDAMAEVESGNSYSRTSNEAYWKHGNNETIYCSHCAVIVGKAPTDAMYRSILENNKFCKNCGRSMKAEVTPPIRAEEIPKTITVAEYNKIWHKKHSNAESFIKLLDSSVGKSGAYDIVMHQLKCIGWPEVQPTLLAALEMYKQIMKSKCAGKTCHTEYRQVTLCENCGKCLMITDDGCICKDRGVMPIDGFCSYGYPKEQDGSAN